MSVLGRSIGGDSREIESTADLFDRLPDLPHGSTGEEIKFTDVDIDRVLATYRPSLSTLSNRTIPNREMVNFISQELARGQAKIPAYAPYVVPELNKPPWAQQTQDHLSANENWKKFSRQAKRSTLPQELSIQAWLLYSIRYVIAADFCAAFVSFGGIGPQINHIGVVLSLSIAENAHVAINYDRVAKSKLQEEARLRNPDAQEFARILSSEQIEYKNQSIKEIGLMSGGNNQFKPKLTWNGYWENQQHQQNQHHQQGAYNIQAQTYLNAHPRRGNQNANQNARTQQGGDQNDNHAINRNANQQPYRRGNQQNGNANQQGAQANAPFSRNRNRR